MSIGYCEAWPEEVKAAAQRVDKLEALLVCRKNWIEHIDPADFDTEYLETQKVQKRLVEARLYFERLKRTFDFPEDAHSKEPAK